MIEIGRLGQRLAGGSVALHEVVENIITSRCRERGTSLQH
jgi:hypothetical protein